MNSIQWTLLRTADASDLSSDAISPEYQEGVPIVKVKDSLKRNIAFWEHIAGFQCHAIQNRLK